jgi:hypothetical protein
MADSAVLADENTITNLESHHAGIFCQRMEARSPHVDM